MLVGLCPNPMRSASDGCRLRICAKCFYNKKDRREPTIKGQALGGLGLSSLFFFLAVLFLRKEQLYILLSFYDFLHLIPCLSVLRVKRAGNRFVVARKDVILFFKNQSNSPSLTTASRFGAVIMLPLVSMFGTVMMPISSHFR